MLFQLDFMQEDQCILVDFEDNVIGRRFCSKEVYSLTIMHQATTINLNVIYLALSDQGESSIAHFLFSCSTSPEGILGFSTKFSIANVSFRLLLQQRAKEKITFPEVWTNTCCSHPLTGYTPTEQDEPHHVADGSVPGVKRAAIRKLEHEVCYCLHYSVPCVSVCFFH
mmetsp:Transcript_30232/g.80009  ORF Transcript_30232/g.80009 Transcript_30232/m.80009 type:complete len:168 (+) Transcript_30232:132-635(+)